MEEPKKSFGTNIPIDDVPDEPDRDTCDICFQNAWRDDGIPFWSCRGDLICEPCYKSEDADDD